MNSENEKHSDLEKIFPSISLMKEEKHWLNGFWTCYHTRPRWEVIGKNIGARYHCTKTLWCTVKEREKKLGFKCYFYWRNAEAYTYIEELGNNTNKKTRSMRIMRGKDKTEKQLKSLVLSV